MNDYKDIKDYEGLYAVSGDGSVYSYKNKRVLKGLKGKNGYVYVGLCKNGIVRQYTVHRLVGEAFIPNPENKPEIDHINGDRQDNRVENLRWATKKENRRNPITTERMSAKKRGLPAKNKKKVIQSDMEGIFIKEYESIALAAEATNTRRTYISNCLAGRQKSANGYKWGLI